MKAFQITLLLAVFSTALFAQNNLSISAKYLLEDLNRIRTENTLHKGSFTPTNAMIEQYDLIKKGSDYLIGAQLLVDRNSFDKRSLLSIDGVVNSELGDLITLRIPVQNLEALSKIGGIAYLEVGESVEPDLTRSVITTRVDSVHLGLGGIAEAYKGEGVIICIIDWGFDYTHPVFYNEDFTDLRLSRAWDQNKNSGPAPAGFSFGTEYIGMNELLDAKEDTLYVFGPGSHGTHVGGIAGGNGGGTANVGIAPKSELIFISLRRDAPSYTDAINYVAQYAESVGKPFVVNMSFGTHLGPHDGTDLKNYAIDQLAGAGKVFVGSAGNNGQNLFHLSKDFSGMNTPDDTLISVVNFSSHAEYFGQTLSMWGAESSSFSAQLLLVDFDDSVLFETAVYNSADEPAVNDTFLIRSDSLYIRIQSMAAAPFNGKPNIRLEVRKTSTFKLVLKVHSPDEGTFHVWNNVRLKRRYTNWGVTLSAAFPGAMVGNDDYGVGEPGGVGKNVISVGSHVNDLYNPNTGELISAGGISSFSSLGPTVDGRSKPDISGPGSGILSSVNLYDPGNASITNTVSFNGLEYPFASYSGTSMSGPTVAGIVALMLQANPLLTHTQVKEIIIATARLDARTGAIGAEGDLQWGHGKINALAAILMAEVVVSNQKIFVGSNSLSLFPNPSFGEISVEGESIQKIRIFDIQGKKVFEENYTFSDVARLDLSHLNSGTFLIQTEDALGIHINKWIKR